ncbi:MAG: hypothetical protein IJW24_00260 [Clostridia bacterium]|nr:hypothetical protein [Clostridia bacterium]
MSAFLQFSEVDDSFKKILKPAESEKWIFYSPEYKEVCDACARLPLDVFEKVITGAIVYSELALKNVGSATIKNVIQVLADHDFDALLKYEQALSFVQEMTLDEKTKRGLLAQIYSSLEPIIDAQNQSLLEISDEFVKKTEKVSSSFSTMSGSSRAELVSKIYSNCTGRMKNFWQRVEPDKFKGVVDALTGELSGANFSEDDLIELSSRCATIFCESTREKILEIEKILNEFKTYALEKVKADGSLPADVVENFEKLEYGHILRKAGSIAKSSPSQVAETSAFLQGKSVGEIFSDIINTGAKNSELFAEFADAKIDLSVRDMIWVMHKNPSIFGSSVEFSLASLKKIKEAMKTSYGKKADEVDFSAMLTRDNFLKGMPKIEALENVSKTIDLLSSVVPANELAAYLANDMKILEMPYERLHAMIVSAFVSSKSTDEIFEALGRTLREGAVFTDDLLKKKKAKAGDEISKTAELSSLPKISVSFESNEMKEVLFEFDMKKLKAFLGPYFDEFARKFKTSDIDKSAIDVVMKRSRDVASRVESCQSRHKGKIFLDGDRLQSLVHDKSIEKINLIEMLWQLQRNIDSEIGLLTMFAKHPNITDKEKQIYITSTNYFKLAVERDEILDEIGFVPIEVRDAVMNARMMVDSSFDTLTKLFAKFISGNTELLARKARELEEQKITLENRMRENSFAGLIGNEDALFAERRKLTEELAMVKHQFEELLMKHDEYESRAKEKRQAIKVEHENPTSEFVGSRLAIGENQSILGVLGVTEIEQQLETELNKILEQAQANVFKIDGLSQRIRDLEKLLDELRLAESYSDVVKITEQRLKNIKSRLAHVYKIKKLAGEESNSESSH